MKLCTHCQAPLPDGLYLCATGLERLYRILRRAHDVFETAGATLTRQSVAPMNREGGKGSSAPGAPLDLGMQQCARQYRETIGFWAKRVAGVQGECAPLDVINRAHWLSRRILPAPGRAGVSKYQWAGDMLDALTKAEARVMTAADGPETRILLGQCGKTSSTETGGTRVCNGRVTAGEGEVLATCDKCRSHHRVQERRDFALAGARHVIAPLPRVVKALNAAGHPLKYDTAKKWMTRGKLAPQCDLRTRTEGVSVADVHALLPKKTTVST